LFVFEIQVLMCKKPNFKYICTCCSDFTWSLCAYRHGCVTLRNYSYLRFCHVTYFELA